jgi:Fe2+ transport system protein FeoA
VACQTGAPDRSAKEATVSQSLADLSAGQWAQVTGLRCREAGRLDRLGAYGLVPGSRIRLVQARPAFIVEIGETVLSVDHAVAREILVQAE